MRKGDRALLAFVIAVALYTSWLNVYKAEDFASKQNVKALKTSEIIGLSADDKQLVEFTRNILIKPDFKKPYILDSPEIYDQSKHNSSTLVLELLKNKTGGFFIECGAYDGENSSNTLLLERKFGWTGLLIEAAPRLIAKMLVKNRKAWIAPTCLSTTNLSMMAIFQDNFFGGKLLQSGSRTSGVLVEAICIPFNTFLLALNVKEVDYFSLDVESHEMDILKTINFQEVQINVFFVEYNRVPENRVMEFMSLMRENGFRLFSKNRQDLVYINKNFDLPPDMKPMNIHEKDVIDSLLINQV